MPSLLIKAVISAGRSFHVLFWGFFFDGVSPLSLTSFNANRVLPTTFSVVDPLHALDSPWISSELTFDEPGVTFRLEVKESADITEVCTRVFNVSCYRSMRTAVENFKRHKENCLMKKRP